MGEQPWSPHSLSLRLTLLKTLLDGHCASPTQSARAFRPLASEAFPEHEELAQWWLHGSRDRSEPRLRLPLLQHDWCAYAKPRTRKGQLALDSGRSCTRPRPTTCVLSSPATSVASRISRLSWSLCRILPRIRCRRPYRQNPCTPRSSRSRQSPPFATDLLGDSAHLAARTPLEMSV